MIPRAGTAIVAVIPFVITGCADTLVLPPAAPPYYAQGTHRRTFVRDGHHLEAFTARPPAAAGTPPGAYVLRFTGGDASGSAAFTATRWNPRNVEIWVVNYPGYGASAGPRQLRALAPAALAAFDELNSIARDRPIFLEGFSLGTVPALAVAARRPVGGVIIQNPPPLRELILGRHGWWNLWMLAGPIALQIPPDLDSIANAKASTAPAIFILAEKDGTIPLPYQRRVADAYDGPRRIILQRGADHFVPLSPADESTLQEAIDDLASPTVPPPPNN